MAPGGSSAGRRRVRPFVVTGGRAAPVIDLRIESMLATVRGQIPTIHIGPEQESILQICTTPRSVAEVAVHLGQPIGVARVVAADLVAAGLLREHTLVGNADSALLERVLGGIRAL
jgi:Protein of unknown function (DUF742)